MPATPAAAPEPEPEESPMTNDFLLGDSTLLAAFWRYERALMTNDVVELDALFADSLETVRSDGGAALVGHDAIAEFRAARPAVPQRYLRRVHVRPIDENSAVIVAETVRDDSGTGTQTQLWQRADAESPWAVAVAHVSTAAGVALGAASGGSKIALTEAEERAIWATPEQRRPLRAAGGASATEAGTGTGAASANAGALQGIRVAVKDLFAIDGEIIGAGNPTFATGRAPETVTAPAVQALIDAGAEITGLAQTDELAFSIAGANVHFGTPPNPAAPGHISGGSTSGPASAVALGLADLGLGTDTAGSIRVPGSYTGLYGLRTTHGAVSRERLIPLAPSFDTVGVLARDLATLEAGAAAILATGGGAFLVSDTRGGAAAATAPTTPAEQISPPLAAPTTSGITPGMVPERAPAPIIRIIVDQTLVALADAPTQLTFASALRALSLNSGVPVVDAGAATPHFPLSPDDLDAWFTAFRVVQQYEAWQADAEFVTANPDALDPAIADRFRVASTITDDEASDARATLDRATRTLDAAIPPGSALALPSTSSGAPSLSADPAEIDRVRAATLRLTCLSSLSGLPALTLPYGRSGTLPVGLCLIGSRGADLALIDLAKPRA
ncbi:DUF3225 domain-containing protein [Subtercola sp. PAMC28395]|uniref:AtzH-like domain-containing protein n=1 Tax=Subtercola sp. PAMC28395 TaxID=2846775 RepID=UPI001C0D7343|nr:AtzH-like domain-containing protein [Subtercola sp. PAMC28395]QWT24850.1 DUF3225 domain-containing protein [Subtercola sp. PAMC28395]